MGVNKESHTWSQQQNIKEILYCRINKMKLYIIELEKLLNDNGIKF